MLPGLGGPMGRHARPRGVWFNPLPWVILAATAVWVLVVLRNLPCVWSDSTNAVNTFIRMCYSDIQIIYVNSGFAKGEPVIGNAETVHFGPVLGVLVMLTTRLGSFLGHPLAPTADMQTQVDNSLIFFACTAVLLYVAFLTWVVCQTLMGRESRNGRYLSWDALIVAVSPAVFFSGLVNWDLIPIALCALGLLLFARGSATAAGMVLALAAGAGSMALVVILAVATAIAMRAQVRLLGQFLVTALVTWVMTHLPLLIRNPTSVFDFYVGQVTGDAGYGSFWYGLQAFGLTPKAAGALGFSIMLLAVCLTIVWLYLTHRRPRIGSLVGAFILLNTSLAGAFPSQMSMWVLFALVLARPHRPEIIAFSLTQFGYYAALMGWLSGHLTQAQGGPENLYYVALFARWAVEVWILVGCYRDMARPERDRLRSPGHSDPIGGKLVGQDEARLVRAA